MSTIGERDQARGVVLLVGVVVLGLRSRINSRSQFDPGVGPARRADGPGTGLARA